VNVTTSTIEDAIPGVGDGVNKNFTTSRDYNAGSLEVFLNGIVNRRQDTDGWTETGSDSFEMKEAPALDDRVRVYFEYEVTI